MHILKVNKLLITKSQTYVCTLAESMTQPSAMVYIRLVIKLSAVPQSARMLSTEVTWQRAPMHATLSASFESTLRKQSTTQRQFFIIIRFTSQVIDPRTRKVGKKLINAITIIVIEKVLQWSYKNSIIVFGGNIRFVVLYPK